MESSQTERRNVAGNRYQLQRVVYCGDLTYTPIAVDQVQYVVDVSSELQCMTLLADFGEDVLNQFHVHTVKPFVFGTVTLSNLSFVLAQVRVLVDVVHEDLFHFSFGVSNTVWISEAVYESDFRRITRDVHQVRAVVTIVVQVTIVYIAISTTVSAFIEQRDSSSQVLQVFEAIRNITYYTMRYCEVRVVQFEAVLRTQRRVGTPY